MSRDPVTPAVRKRYEDLCRLAAAPGTPAEGRAARRQVRKMQRRYGLGEPRGIATSTLGPSERRRHVLGVACWLSPGRAAWLALVLPQSGTLLAVGVRGGMGYEWEDRLLAVARVVEVPTSTDPSSLRTVEVGHRFDGPCELRVLVKSRNKRTSRVSVHVTVELDGQELPVLALLTSGGPSEEER